MVHGPTTVPCPACGVDVLTEFAVGDGGTTDPPTDDLFGREVSCSDCDASFEVLFYPE